MESTRQQKIERLIQKDLSDIFLRYARAIRGTLISVSEVRISPDLSIAHIYLSIFPQDKTTYSERNEVSRNFLTHDPVVGFCTVVVVCCLDEQSAA